MPRPCVICCHQKRQQIDALIATGVSDREVTRQFGIANVSVWRHRTNHIIKPAQHRLAIINKGAPERREREALAREAAADVPSAQAYIEANFGQLRQAEKLVNHEAYIERGSALAEATGSPNAMVPWAREKLRGFDAGNHFAGHPGYGPPQMQAQGADAGGRFSVQIVFAGSGRTESFTTSVHPPTIDSTDFSSSGSGEPRDVARGEARDEDPEDDQDEAR
jgi:hypothetical protein